MYDLLVDGMYDLLMDGVVVFSGSYDKCLDMARVYGAVVYTCYGWRWSIDSAIVESD